MGVEGKKFGKYVLLKKIATGGMAEIFLARMSGMAGFNREVCIKRIHRYLSEEPDFIKMFLDEARLMAYLNHPNIVSVYEFGKVGNAYYLALEYIHGVSLAQLIKKTKGVKLEHAIKITSDICAALHYAHNLKDKNGKPLGIVHRDVSPQNVLISYEGAVKMIDFGVAKATTQLHETRAGTFKGKYAYMSPEQCRGERIDHRSDIFAVGILLYEMLTGKGLFHRENIFDTMEAVLNLNPPPVRRRFPDYPPEIDQIIAKAMAKDREKRFQTAEEMQIALEELAVKYKLHSSGLLLSRYIKEVFKEELEEEEIEEISLSEIQEVGGEEEGEVELFISTGTLESEVSPKEERGTDFLEFKEDEITAKEEIEEPLKEWDESDEDPTIAMNKSPKPIEELIQSPADTREVKVSDEIEPAIEKEEIALLPSDKDIVLSKEEEKKKGRFSIFWIGINLLLLLLIIGGVLFLWFKTDYLKGLREKVEKKKAASISQLHYKKEELPKKIAKLSKKEKEDEEIVILLDGGKELDIVRDSEIQFFKEKDIEEDKRLVAKREDIEEEAFMFSIGEEGKGEEREGISSINIITRPDGASVWINGKKLSEETPIIGYETKPGSYLVKVFKKGYKIWKKRIRLEKGEEEALEIILEREKGGRFQRRGGEGVLFLNTIPYSEVFIKGKSYGYTPIANLKLKARSYKVTFKLPDGTIIKKNIVIKADEVTRLKFDFREKKREAKGKVEKKVSKEKELKEKKPQESKLEEVKKEKEAKLKKEKEEEKKKEEKEENKEK